MNFRDILHHRVFCQFYHGMVLFICLNNRWSSENCGRGCEREDQICRLRTYTPFCGSWQRGDKRRRRLTGSRVPQRRVVAIPRQTQIQASFKQPAPRPVHQTEVAIQTDEVLQTLASYMARPPYH